MEAIAGHIFELLSKIWSFFIPFTVVREYEGCIVLRFGKFNRIITASSGVKKTGFHWIIPFLIEEVHTAQIATETITTKPQSLTTSDGVNVVVSAAIKCNVENPEIYLLKVKDVTNAIGDVVQGIVKKMVMESSWEQCRADDFDTRLTGRTKTQGEKWGLKVQNVTLIDLASIVSIRLIQNDIEKHNAEH